MKNNKILLSVLAVSAIAALVACSPKATTSSAVSSIVSQNSVTPSETVSSEEVSSAENVKTFLSAIADTTDAKVEYKPGEKFTSEGLKLIIQYNNTIGGETTETVTDLKDYTITVRDSSGEEVTGALTTIGTYNVSVVKDEISTVYSIKVEGYDINFGTVSEALTLAYNNRTAITESSAVVTTKYDKYQMVSEFGKSYTDVKQNTYNSETEKYEFNSETFIGKTDDESFYGLTNTGNGYSKSYDTFDDIDMEGAKFDVFSYYGSLTGAENAIFSLYNEGKDVSGYQESITHDDEKLSLTGTFSFTSSSHGSEFAISVEFTMNNYGVITNAVITSNSTTSSYKAEITQTYGERTAENPIPYDSLFIKGYVLKDETGTVVDSKTAINAKCDTAVVLTIDSIDPESANINYDEILFLDKNGNETSFLTGDIVAYVNTNNQIQITPKVGGDLTLTMVTKYTSVTLKLHVEYKNAESIDVQVYEEDSYGYVSKDEITVVEGKNVLLKGVVNKGADPAYTASLEDTYEGVTLTLNEAGVYSFTAETAGQYVVNFVSSTNSEVTDSITINVEEPKSVSELCSGSYSFTDEGVDASAVFAPDAEEDGKGTLNITISVDGEALGALFDYDISSGEVVFTKVTGDDIASVAFNDDGNLVVIDSIGWDYTLTQDVESSSLTGTYSGDGYTFVFSETTFDVTYNGNTGTYTYEFDGKNLTWEGKPDSGTNIFNNCEPYLSSGTLSGENIVLTGMFGNVTVVPGEAEEAGLVVGENTLYAEYFGTEYTFTAAASGTYTFTADGINGGLSIYSIDELPDDPGTELSADLSAGDTYTFYAYALVEDGDITVTISFESDELIVGENTVNANYDGAEYTFTAPEDGIYTFSVTQDDSVAGLALTPANDLTEDPTSSLNVILSEGDEYTFYLIGANPEDEPETTLTIKREDITVTELELGDNKVKALYDGTTVTFEAPYTGKFIVTCTSGDFFGFLNEDDESIDNASVEYELEAGETATIVVFANIGGGTAVINVARGVTETLLEGNNLIEAGESVYTFTATDDCEVTISSYDSAFCMIFVDSEGNIDEENTEWYYSTYLPEAVSLKAGESLYMHFENADLTGASDIQYEIDISVAKVVNFALGDNNIDATYSGAEATFTAEEAGDYTFTYVSGDFYSFAKENESGCENLSNPYTVTLAEGESITLLVQSDSFTGGTAVINVAKAAAEETTPAYVGTYKGKAASTDITIVLKADGTGTYDGNDITYEFNATTNKITFTVVSLYDVELTFNEEEGTLKGTNDDGDSCIEVSVTKQQAD